MFLNKKMWFAVSAAIFTVVFFTITVNGCAQDSEKIIGTIGNEKMGSDKIVICVYGTAACMPVNIDSDMTVKYKGNETKLTELPFGLYLEADVVKDKKGTSLRTIIIDENKTVLCFRELGKEKEHRLSAALPKIQGVKSFNINSDSKQSYIEFDSNTLSYKDLENKVKKAGFELE